MNSKKIVIVGAGPAGLTAAYELYQAGHRNIEIFEATGDIGGLSKTVNYRGNRIDIGGHRFFSKSKWVMDWWLDKIPLADSSEPHSLARINKEVFLAYQGQRKRVQISDLASQTGSAVMLIRDRLSRILFAGNLFDYPLRLNFDTLKKLGLLKCVSFGLSYLKARILPRKTEKTLEDFFINRFGARLYRQFFKTYTEKVWGQGCDKISAEWGAQRVKSLSVAKALIHAIKRIFFSKATIDAEQTSLIEHFFYPKLGPGQMWETVAKRLQEYGIGIRKHCTVTGLALAHGKIVGIDVLEHASGRKENLTADIVISSMPMRDLVTNMEGDVPSHVRQIAGALEYRDFMTVGLLYRKLTPRDSRHIPGRADLPDNWIYIQEPNVHVGRVQIFNNWSPYMVHTPGNVWVGLEFFCAEGDALWRRADSDLLELAKNEMAQLGLGLVEDSIDGVVIRIPKAYPGYYGAYDRFSEVRDFLDGIPNLFLVGRNGMHRYNNQDHSMLSAKCAVEAIISGSSDKSAIWAVNVDDEYHEEITKEPAARESAPAPARAVA